MTQKETDQEIQNEKDNSEPTLGSLLRNFFPLALSDFAMTVGDTFRNLALVRLAYPNISVAAIGIIKSVAILLESPVIMILHASTALSVNAESHRQLWRLTIVLSLCLTGIFAFLSWGPIYEWLLLDVFGANQQVMEAARFGFVLLLPWPGIIAFRRFFQGILIRAGHRSAVAHAGMLRLMFTCMLLWIGVKLQWNGVILVSISLSSAILVESAFVISFVKFYKSARYVGKFQGQQGHIYPTTFGGVARYFLPLGSTSLLIWTGKAVLVGIIVRATDGYFGLSAWVIATGLVLPMANTTRMVQQLTISVRDTVSKELLFNFASVVGIICCLPLIILGFTPPGHYLLKLFLGGEFAAYKPSLLTIQILSLLPFAFALQTYYQGLLMRAAANWWINAATMLNVGVTFLLTITLTYFGNPGAASAAVGTMIGQLVEVLLSNWLCKNIPI